MTDDTTRYFNMRWWWEAGRPEAHTWPPEELEPHPESDVVKHCQHGPEVWERLDEDRDPTQEFWVITPEIARIEMVLWGPYDDYDHAVMIAATLH